MSKKVVLFASSATLALVLSACTASGGTSSLDNVDYNLNGATAEPSVSFATPFAVDSSQTHLIEEGTGEDIKDGDELVISASIFNGADGSTSGSTYTSSDLVIPVNEELKNNAPELYEILTSNKEGVSFSYATNLEQSSTEDIPVTASPGTPSNLEIYTVQRKLPKTASGPETPQDQIDPALQSFTISPDDGSATITLAEDRGDPPTELVSQNLITGDGETVGENDTVFTRYQVVQWSDGKVADNAYGNDKYVQGIPLNQVVEGWKQGLAGKTVGSRVLLIIPADLAYGEEHQGNSPAGALVFVVDILGTSKGAPTASASPETTASESVSAEPSTTETSE